MPANPGAKTANEKAKKKRLAAQKARTQRQAQAAARAPTVTEEQVAAEQDEDAPFKLSGKAVLDFDELDELSAEVPKLLKKKQVDEAARICADMVRRFPGEPDGWQRFSAVWEARGELAKALADMERAATRVSVDDEGTVKTIEKEVERLRKRVARA